MPDISDREWLWKVCRMFGAAFGIGTLLVVTGFPAAGYTLWLFVNAAMIAVGVHRRDGWSVALFGCYEAATIYGLLSL